MVLLSTFRLMYPDLPDTKASQDWIANMPHRVQFQLNYGILVCMFCFHTRGRAFTSSHCSNCCYTTRFIGRIVYVCQLSLLALCMIKNWKLNASLYRLHCTIFLFFASRDGGTYTSMREIACQWHVHHMHILYLGIMKWLSICILVQQTKFEAVCTLRLTIYLALYRALTYLWYRPTNFLRSTLFPRTTFFRGL